MCKQQKLVESCYLEKCNKTYKSLSHTSKEKRHRTKGDSIWKRKEEWL